MTVIRKAKESDLGIGIRLGKDFHDASPMKNVADYSEDTVKNLLIKALHEENTLLLVAELDDKIVGFTCCILYPLYFNSNFNVAQELWWWMTPDARGKGIGKRMFEGIQDWAKEKKAKALFMVALENDHSEIIGSIYTKSGLKPLEKTFFKEISK